VLTKQKAEELIHRRETLLRALQQAIHLFLDEVDWEKHILEILRLLGNAADVDRVYIFKNHVKADRTIYTSQCFEWVASGVESQMGNPSLQDIPWEESGFTRWLTILKKGDIVTGRVKDFPIQEQELLLSQGIIAIAIVPIFVGNELWGFIGFDECTRERIWDRSEIDVLRMAADTVGMAILRKRNEDALKKSKDQYRSIVENARDIIFRTDPKGIITYVNPAVLKKTGYRKEELIGMNYLDLVHPNDVEEVKSIIREMFRQHSAESNFDCRILTRNREMLWVDNIATILKEGKEIVGWQSIARDITQQKQLEYEQKVLHKFSQQLNGPLTIKEIALLAARTTKELFDHDVFSLDLLDEEKDELVGVYNEDLPPGGTKPVEYPAKSVPVEKVRNREILEGQSKLINRKSDTEQSDLTRFGNETRPSRSLMFVPIIWRNKTVGVLSVQSYTPNKYGYRDLALLEMFGYQCGGALARAWSEQSANERLQELELFYKVTIDRELKMVELKKKIAILEKRLSDTRNGNR